MGILNRKKSEIFMRISKICQLDIIKWYLNRQKGCAKCELCILIIWFITFLIFCIEFMVNVIEISITLWKANGLWFNGLMVYNEIFRLVSQLFICLSVFLSPVCPPPLTDYSFNRQSVHLSVCSSRGGLDI